MAVDLDPQNVGLVPREGVCARNAKIDALRASGNIGGILRLKGEVVPAAF